MEKKQFKTELGGRTLTMEVSSLAEQANAAVLAKYGETVVLATVVMSHKDTASDYLPLRVDYEERFYAVGKILGSRFMRREGRASDEAILSGRMIDRTIRPLFDQRIRRDMQVVTTVLAYDGENDPDYVGLIAASTALSISDIPWSGPVAGVTVGKVSGNYVVNPLMSDRQDEKLAFETFVAGPKGKISMIELGGLDVPEDEVMLAFAEAQKNIDALVDFQHEIIKAVGKPKAEVKLSELDPAVRATAEEFLKDRLAAAVYPHLGGGKRTHALDKKEREHRLSVLKDELFASLISQNPEANLHAAEGVFEEEVDALVHKNILESDLRPDGRKLDELRGLEAQVGLFERTHGSALFVRGNTQALAITTLGAPGASQIVETMMTDEKRRFMLHYNFPPYSVGEVGRMGAPGRREIGHGALARKAIEPLLPKVEDFPYVVRVVSEIVSSNGSSSMATVCASLLSMMDAGVPIKKIAAGIAMGVMTDDKGNYKVLTDIQGPEDHYGDMDFKVAGTRDGVNAVQLDVKFHGLTTDVIKATLLQAKKARFEIMDVMEKTLAKPRPAISKYAPAIVQMKINPEKIGMVIGPGGKTINGMIEKYGLEAIDIEEDGGVFVAGRDMQKVNAAIEEIKALTREYKVGEIVEGPIIKVLDFGAILDLGGGKDGMIHVSELKNGFVKNVTDVVKEGDSVRAKIIRVETDGRIGLSIKQL